LESSSSFQAQSLGHWLEAPTPKGVSNGFIVRLCYIYEWTQLMYLKEDTTYVPHSLMGAILRIVLHSMKLLTLLYAIAPHQICLPCLDQLVGQDLLIP
jgi:hypothetical protein